MIQVCTSGLAIKRKYQKNRLEFLLHTKKSKYVFTSVTSLLKRQLGL